MLVVSRVKEVQELLAVTTELPRLSTEQFVERYGSGPRREWAAAVYQAMLQEAERLSRPGSLYAEYSLEEVQALVPWLPQGSLAVVLGLCTLGFEVEKRIRELFEDEAPSAVVLDEICLALVGAMARQIHRTVRRRAEEGGLHAGPPYRPGLGHWPLEAQRTLFARLPAQEIGVSLSANLVMKPAKTTSLIIPLLAKRKSYQERYMAEKGEDGLKEESSSKLRHMLGNESVQT